MQRDHGAFEALAGAVLLGEASPAERAEFERHAAACGQCAADTADAIPLERVRQARDGETWRPQVGGALVARVREARSKNARRTFGALGYAAGLSIVLNVAVATGFADRLYERLEQRAAPVALPAAPLPAARIASRPALKAARPQRYYIQRPLTAPLPAKVARRASGAAGRLGDVPDVLAGLVQPRTVTASRDVAQEAFSLDATPADRPH